LKFTLAFAVATPPTIVTAATAAKFIYNANVSFGIVIYQLI
jgi:hypothetical protein